MLFGGGLEKYPVFEIGKAADIENERAIEPAPVAHDRELEGVIDENDGGGQETVAQSGDRIEADAGQQ